MLHFSNIIPWRETFLFRQFIIDLTLGNNGGIPGPTSHRWGWESVEKYAVREDCKIYPTKTINIERNSLLWQPDHFSEDYGSSHLYEVWAPGSRETCRDSKTGTKR